MTVNVGALIIDRVEAAMSGHDEADTVVVRAHVHADSGGGIFTWEIPAEVFLRAAFRFDPAK